MAKMVGQADGKVFRKSVDKCKCIRDGRGILRRERGALKVLIFSTRLRSGAD